MRRLLLAAAVLASLVACSKREIPADASILVDHAGPQLAFHGHKIDLPANEVRGEDTKVFRDESGKHLYYRTFSPIEARVLYVLESDAFVGPIVKYPIDEATIPALDTMYGETFERAGTRRPSLAKAVQREHGGEGLVKLLLAAAGASGNEWDAIRTTIPVANEPAFRAGIEPLLASANTNALARAAKEVSLLTPERTKLVAEKASLLTATYPWVHGRAAAALLRAALADEPASAGAIACAALKNAPRGGIVDPDDRTLREAIFVALAVSNVECANPHVAEPLADACSEAIQCNGKLCTQDELAPALKAQTARLPNSVFAEGLDHVDHTPMYAYYILLGRHQLPEKFLLAQARRQYTIDQVVTPDCTSVGSEGLLCHCSPSKLLAGACRRLVDPIHPVKDCTFEVDDAKKKIGSVLGSRL